MLNRYARSAVMKDQRGADFPWKPEAVKDIDEYDASIFSSPSLVVLCEGESKPEQENVRSALLTVAESLQKESDGQESNVLVFIGTHPDGYEKKIRSSTRAVNVQGSKPNSVEVLLLDKPDGCFYALRDKPTVENLRKFLNDYQEGKLEPLELDTEDSGSCHPGSCLLECTTQCVGACCVCCCLLTYCAFKIALALVCPCCLPILEDAMNSETNEKSRT